MCSVPTCQRGEARDLVTSFSVVGPAGTLQHIASHRLRCRSAHFSQTLAPPLKGELQRASARMGQAASKEGRALVDAVNRDDAEAVRTVSHSV